MANPKRTQAVSQGGATATLTDLSAASSGALQLEDATVLPPSNAELHAQMSALASTVANIALQVQSLLTQRSDTASATSGQLHRTRPPERQDVNAANPTFAPIGPDDPLPDNVVLQQISFTAPVWTSQQPPLPQQPRLTRPMTSAELNRPRMSELGDSSGQLAPLQDKATEYNNGNKFAGAMGHSQWQQDTCHGSTGKVQNPVSGKLEILPAYSLPQYHDPMNCGSGQHNRYSTGSYPVPGHNPIYTTEPAIMTTSQKAQLAEQARFYQNLNDSKNFQHMNNQSQGHEFNLPTMRQLKVDLPTFSGDDPTDWLHKADLFFSFY